MEMHHVNGRLKCSWLSSSTFVFLLSLLCLLCVHFTTASVIRHKRQDTESSPTISDIQTLLDPMNEVDLVLMIDSSKGMGKSSFYTKERTILRAILTQYAVIMPARVRLAAIVFAVRTDTVFDYISESSSPGSEETLNKCELFRGSETESIWGKIQYFDEVADNQHTELLEGLTKAGDIFTSGRARRPDPTQILLIATDADINTADYTSTINKAAELRDTDNINIFVIGTGTWVKPGNAEVIANDGYFAFHVDWVDLLTTAPYTTYGPEDPFLFQELPLNISYCGSCRENSACYGNPYSGKAVCKCDKGHTYVRTGEIELCTPCGKHEYKDVVGDQPCSDCPPPTENDERGATDISACICKEDNPFQCEAECVPNPCGVKSRCYHAGVQNINCFCLDGWDDAFKIQADFMVNISCTIRTLDECDDNACQNGATCVDMDGDYACVCPFGYTGDRCEIEKDMCEINFCQNGATCTSKVNGFTCDCAYGFKGTYCQEIGDTTISTTPSTTAPSTTSTPPTTTPTTTTGPTTTAPATTTAPTTTTAPATTTTVPPTTTEPPTTTTPPSTSVTTPTPQPVTGDDNTMLYIIIGCCAGGLLLIIIIITIICCCCCCRKRKQEEEKPPVVEANGKSEGARLYRKNRSAKQTMSNRFSDFWRKKTMRPGSFFFNETKGVPSVPIRRRPDLSGLQEGQDGFSTLQSDSVVEYAVMDNQQIQDTGGMDGWMQYVNEIQGNRLVERACILKLSGKKRACSSNWEYDAGEVDKVMILLENKDSHVPAVVQRGEYHIHENDGTIASGRTIGSEQDSKVIAIGRTKTFLIIGIADANTDTGLCLKEIQWMTDHIKNEGY